MTLQLKHPAGKPVAKVVAGILPAVSGGILPPGAPPHREMRYAGKNTSYTNTRLEAG